jgi:serine/threonine protein kinase
MLGFEAQSVIADFADAQLKHPMQRKVFPTHTVYLSHNDFGLLRKTTDEHPILTMTPKIVDFGLAQRGDTKGGDPLIFPIQVYQFHAPEVLLGAGWSYSADIWNLGVMVSSTTSIDSRLNLSRSGSSLPARTSFKTSTMKKESIVLSITLPICTAS